MISLSIANSASVIPAWLAIAGAVVGLVGGVGGAIVSVVNVRNARKAIWETRMTPVRQRQHDLIDRLVDQLPELQSALEAVNLAVQQPGDGSETRTAMEKVDLVTRQITTPEVTDPELRERLGKLQDAVLNYDDTSQNFVQMLHSYAGLQDRLHNARQPFAQQAAQVDALVQLAATRGRDQEPMRKLNDKAIAAAKTVGERLGEIQRDGLGEIPSERPWLLAMRRNRHT